MIEVHDVILLKEAVDDLNAGEQFYKKKEYGLGDRFYNSLLDDLDQLYLYAGIHFKQFGLYRLLSRKFPTSNPFIPVTIINFEPNETVSINSAIKVEWVPNKYNKP